MRQSSREDLLDELVEMQSGNAVAPTLNEGVVIGRVVAITATGQVLVDYEFCHRGEPCSAKSTVFLERESVGSEVVLLFERGNPRRPIIVGVIQTRVDGIGAPKKPQPLHDVSSARVEKDGERIELTANSEIVLRCGKGSITITRAGKVVIRGEYLVSRSTGVNRIKGGTVQIN